MRSIRVAIVGPMTAGPWTPAPRDGRPVQARPDHAESEAMKDNRRKAGIVRVMRGLGRHRACLDDQGYLTGVPHETLRESMII
jgi:hypothetical protein